MMQLRTAALALLVVLAGCASTGRITLDYEGPDAGRVIIGLGSDDPIRGVAMLFREAGAANPEVPRGELVFRSADLEAGHPAAYGTEAESGDRGIVVIASLAPGEYELYNVLVDLGDGGRPRSLREPFSVRFVVGPGETTYLTNIQTNIFSTDHGTSFFFVVEDRFETDVAVARRIEDSLPRNISNQSIAPLEFDSPFFVLPRKKGAYPE